MRDKLSKTVLVLSFIIMFSFALSFGLAEAQSDYPNKSIHWIVPVGPGGGVDSLTRGTASFMPAYLPNKVGIVVENVSTPAWLKGIDQLYSSKPDGYTVGTLITTVSIVAQLKRGAKWDVRALTPLGNMNTTYYGLFAKIDSPYDTVADIVKANEPVRWSIIPGEVEVLTKIAAKTIGVESSFVGGYKGSADQILGMIRGDTDFVINNAQLITSYSSEVKLLATFSLEVVYEGVQCATDLGYPELVKISEGTSLFYCCFGPPNMPEDRASILTEALHSTVTDKGFLKFTKRAGLTAAWKTPQQIRRNIEAAWEFYNAHKELLK